MGGQRRRRLDMRGWREVMLRFDEAGESVKEFCGRERVSASSFYRWRERLGSGGGAGLVGPSRGWPSSLSVQPSAAGFIDLGQLGEPSCVPSCEPSCEPCAGLELRLDLGGGVVLQIVRR